MWGEEAENMRKTALKESGWDRIGWTGLRWLRIGRSDKLL